MFATILLIRHAEKPDEVLHETGIDSHGRDDSYSLSWKGWQRAEELAGFFYWRRKDPAGAGSSFCLCVPSWWWS